MYDIVSEIYHTCCVHFCMYLIFSRRSNKVFDLLVWWANLMQLCFWNSQPSDIMIRMAAFTTYQHCHTFSCCRNGPHMFFHVIAPSMYSNHSEMEKWHVPKNSLYTDILPLEVSYLYWYESMLYIWYFCEWLTTWLILKFWFLQFSLM